MKLFSGFPAGKLRVTPLPNLFFSELLSAIDDLAELKVTLHIMWLLAQPEHASAGGGTRRRFSFVTTNELRADQTLMRSLAVVEAKPEEALTRGLERASERGTLLHLLTSNADLYLLNSEAGRRALEEIERDGIKVRNGAGGEAASVAERPNIFTLYEQNIGLLSPMIAEELREAEFEYPADWVLNAFRIAVERNKRSWSYVRAILERWKTEGLSGDAKKGKPWYGDEYGKFVKR